MNWSISCAVIHAVFVDMLFGQPEDIDLNIYSYQSEKLEDLCGRNVVVQRYINIQSHFHGGATCVISFSTKDNETSLTAYFLEYYASDKCAGPINILNSKDEPLLGLNGYCGTKKPREYFNLGTRGSLRFVKPDKTIETELRVVEYSRKNESCPPDTFDCEYQNLCIAGSLTCDYYPDCPKGRDEQNKCADNTQVGFYVFFGALATLFFLCVGAVIFCEEMSRRRRVNQPLSLGDKVLQPDPFLGSVPSAGASLANSQPGADNRTPKTSIVSATEAMRGSQLIAPFQETLV